MADAKATMNIRFSTERELEILSYVARKMGMSRESMVRAVVLEHCAEALGTTVVNLDKVKLGDKR